MGLYNDIFCMNEKMMVKTYINQSLGHIDNQFFTYLSIWIDFMIIMGSEKL